MTNMEMEIWSEFAFLTLNWKERKNVVFEWCRKNGGGKWLEEAYVQKMKIKFLDERPLTTQMELLDEDDARLIIRFCKEEAGFLSGVATDIVSEVQYAMGMVGQAVLEMMEEE